MQATVHGVAKSWTQLSDFTSYMYVCIYIGPLVAQMVKHLSISVGDLGSIPGSERFPGEGNGNPLQYSCLGNPVDRGGWWATVQGVTHSQTRLSDCAYNDAGKGHRVCKNPAQRVAGQKRDRP